tara:strand:- start:1447 stop:2376 length:930 start_codon:yes stop_codon:yes gene_type:complete
MKYYVVHKGKKPGIYSNWDECKKQVDGFNGPIFKKFENKKDADDFLKNGFKNNNGTKFVKKEIVDKKNEKLIENELNSDEEKIFIYTDGSCIKFDNGIFKAGYGIYIPSKNIKISEPLLNQKQTNNRAELTSILESIKYLSEREKKNKIIIITDSQYSMYIFKDTGLNYEKKNFIKDGKEVLNKDLIIKALHIKRNYNISLLKIRAHTSINNIHVKNNAIVDELAKTGVFKHGNYNLFNKKKDEEESDEEEGFYSCDYFERNKFNLPHPIDIKKDIKMNELFEYEELSNKNEIKNKSTKLNNWFIKVKK